jgi:hypothetical protein
MSDQKLDSDIGVDCYKVHITGESIFRGDSDYLYFMSLLGRYLSPDDTVEALAYCMAPDRFDLLLNQTKNDSIERLINNIVTTYNLYYFEKYNSESVMSSNAINITKISSDNLLEHSCALHVQKNNWIDCPYSSVRAYLYDDTPSWLNKKRISSCYESAVNYLELLDSASEAKKK